MPQGRTPRKPKDPTKEREYQQRNRDKNRTERPWVITYLAVYNRCNIKSNNKYIFYGGRGIKLLMSRDDFKELWFRDKAYKMIRPSIDRIDNNGDYTTTNCRYVELKENVSRVNGDKTRCIRGHLFTKDNTRVDKNGYRRCRACIRDRKRQKCVAKEEA